MNCHYEVRVTNIKVGADNEMDFDYTVKSFYNEQPLEARKQAFEYYEDYLSGILESQGHKYISDSDARQFLEPYLNPKGELILNFDNELEGTYYLFFGIAVFFINDKKRAENIDDKIDEIEDEDLKILIQQVVENPVLISEQLIHGIGYYGASPINPRNFINDLWFEFMAFSEEDISNETIQIMYCDEGKEVVEEYEILPTPFDWSVFQNPENQPEVSIISHDHKINQLLEGGETDQVEFKPALVYNFKTREGAIGVKHVIAKSICGFLNTKGGFLLIGITDNGTAQGLKYDYSLSNRENPRDYFRLEFDDMINQFLPHWVYDYISMSIIEHEGKDICVVMVSPSKKEPVFVNVKSGKEFYIRRTASTKCLNVQEFFEYYKIHWN